MEISQLKVHRDADVDDSSSMQRHSIIKSLQLIIVDCLASAGQ